MTRVQRLKIGEDADGKRLDRWMRAKFPRLTQSKIEKYCRKGQVRLDGKRVKASDRLMTGQCVRLPPMPDSEARAFAAAPPPVRISAADSERMRAAVIYIDDDFLAINKPPGTPVQGGTGQSRHVDSFASTLRFGKSENPRLVHRLDKDTSGVLVMARSEKAAREISEIFRKKEIRKQYLAVLAGVPSPFEMTIRLALAPSNAHGPDRMQCIEPSSVVKGSRAKYACTGYKVIEHVGKRASLVALTPVTGRKHQLRAHMAAIGHPIIGDRKYGREESKLVKFRKSPALGGEFSAMLHLHARSIAFENPFTGREVRVVAPLPPHFSFTLASLGWNCDAAGI